MKSEAKIDPKRIEHKQSFEWQGVIMSNGKTAGETYKGKTPKKPTTKKK